MRPRNATQPSVHVLHTQRTGLDLLLHARRLTMGSTAARVCVDLLLHAGCTGRRRHRQQPGMK